VSFPSPSLTPPTLANWQFGYNGVVIGASQPAGVLQVQGLGDLATVRSGDIARPRDHGELIGLDVFGGRDIQINVAAFTDATSLQDTLNAIANATPVGLTTEQPLWFNIPGYPAPLASMCRTRKRATPWDFNYSAAVFAQPVLTLHSTDPRIYAAGQQVTVGLPTPTGGLTFPATFPLTFGSGGGGGVVVQNAGNTEMRPVLVITGPVTNPQVSNGSISGTPTVKFSNPLQTSYTVLAGDQLVVDLDLHTILYYTGGVGASAPASRGNWLVSGSTWWDLLPASGPNAITGGNNTIQFNSADSVSVAGTCTVQWASAYQL